MQASQACSYMFLLEVGQNQLLFSAKMFTSPQRERNSSHTFLETWDWVPRIDFEAPEDKETERRIEIHEEKLRAKRSRFATTLPQGMDSHIRLVHHQHQHLSAIGSDGAAVPDPGLRFRWWLCELVGAVVPCISLHGDSGGAHSTLFLVFLFWFCLVTLVAQALVCALAAALLGSYYLTTSKYTTKATVLATTTASLGMLLSLFQNLGVLNTVKLEWPSELTLGTVYFSFRACY